MLVKLLLGRTAPGSGDTPPRPSRTECPRFCPHRAASHAPDAWTSDACGTDRITHTHSGISLMGLWNNNNNTICGMNLYFHGESGRHDVLGPVELSAVDPDARLDQQHRFTVRPDKTSHYITHASYHLHYHTVTYSFISHYKFS